MKAAIYARVSTDEQNVETQLKPQREYCQARGWEIVNEYVDEGIAGSEAIRPQLNLMMQHARNRFFKVVLVWKYDRLFRSVEHMLSSLDTFRNLGIDFVSMTEAVDTSTPMGKLFYTIAAGFSEFEQSLIRERTLAGMARARAEGRLPGRPRVTIDIDHAKKLWNNGNGFSLGNICKELGCKKTTLFLALRNAVPKVDREVKEHQIYCIGGENGKTP